MTHLTPEQFEKILTERLAAVATKQDVREGVEELARTVNSGFQHVDQRLEEVVGMLDVRERMHLVEQKLHKVEEALRLKLYRQNAKAGPGPCLLSSSDSSQEALPPTPEPVAARYQPKAEMRYN